MMFDGVDAYVFDLYGTLVDYGSLRDRYLGLVADPDAFVASWRQKQIAYSFAATLMGVYEDFDALSGRAFDYVCAQAGLAIDPARTADAVAAWSSLPAYPDAVATLAGLRARGAKTAVLSNGTPAAVAVTLSNTGLAPYLDEALSIDAVRRYKPHPDVYRLATARFSTIPARIVFVSSNGWDATGAAVFGFRVAWCNRANLPAETLGPPPERTLRALAELLT
jgi:2-haloacid dehalogenase